MAEGPCGFIRTDPGQFFLMVDAELLGCCRKLVAGRGVVDHERRQRFKELDGSFLEVWFVRVTEGMGGTCRSTDSQSEETGPKDGACAADQPSPGQATCQQFRDRVKPIWMHGLHLGGISGF
jgi:hypothetical protein